MTTRIAVLMAVMIAGGGGAAVAQTAADSSRIRVNLNAGMQMKSETLTGTSTFTVYDEPGTLSSSQELGSGPTYDVEVGVRLWKSLTAGVTWQQATTSGDAAVAGLAPHPLYFGRPRGFSATLADLSRSEQAVHMSFGWLVPMGNRIDLNLAAGPTVFRVSQEVATSANLSEASAPFTSVTATVSSGTTKGGATGFHVAADAAYRLTRNLGIGALVRYSSGNAEISVGSGRVETTAGGFQIGGGLRLRF